jgi:hypothetical protein
MPRLDIQHGELEIQAGALLSHSNDLNHSRSEPANKPRGGPYFLNVYARRSHKRPSGIDQTRSIVASQAWAPFSSIVTANIAGSIDLIDQLSTKRGSSSTRQEERQSKS